MNVQFEEGNIRTLRFAVDQAVTTEDSDDIVYIIEKLIDKISK